MIKTSISSQLCLDLFVDVADWTIDPTNERIALATMPVCHMRECRHVLPFDLTAMSAWRYIT